MAKWQPIETAPSGRPVLIHYRNSHGKSRVIKARHVKRWTEEATEDCDDNCQELHEETETYYLVEGWWECVDNWDIEPAVHEGVPNHWQPLPAPPSEGE